jgi:uncharacterized protein YjiS (DUF1127 family)
MATFFKNFGQRYTEYMIRQGRKQARAALLGKSNRVLEDIGISRDLLEKGTEFWPWTLVESQPAQVAEAAPVARLSRREERRAIRTLRALSDRELLDMGITRGTIVHAVRHGRPADVEAARVARQPAVIPTAIQPTTLHQPEQPVEQAERLQAA